MTSLLHYLTLPYITIHFHSRFHLPVPKLNSRTCAHGFIMLPPRQPRVFAKFFTLYTYYQVFYRYFMVDSSYTFSKNLQFDYLFLEIFRLQLRKKPFLLLDSKRDQYLQWLPTMIRNENALLSVTLLQLCQR